MQEIRQGERYWLTKEEERIQNKRTTSGTLYWVKRKV
jgi:hypothetical protein